MLVTESIEEIRSAVKLWRREKLKIGLVPTMGALHDGHLALIRKAKEKTSRVVVSVFVNPEQFGPGEDFDRYPRKLDGDLKFCQKNRVTAVFTPAAADIYPEPRYFKIGMTRLNEHMCGASRPGFFEGVSLIVNKLLNIVDPDVVVFGQKDIQQYIILNRMMLEFNHCAEMVMGDIVRANDGLALSSRNVYLNNEERLIAPSLYRSLSYVEKQIKGGVTEPGLLIAHQMKELEEKGFKIDYFGLFSRENMEPVNQVKADSRYILAGAVYLGKTRLIDNLLLVI